MSGDQVDQVFAQLNFGLTYTSDAEKYPLTDALGSVRAVQTIDGQSDVTTGAFTGRPEFVEYDAWGNMVWTDATVRNGTRCSGAVLVLEVDCVAGNAFASATRRIVGWKAEEST